MLFLISLALAFAFAFFCGTSLKKHPYIFYSAAVLLTVGMSFLPSVNTRDLPVFVNTYVLGLFTRGAFATALWCVVMLTGALKNGSVPMKKLMPIRGELSIFAAVLTLGHNIGYGRTYFVMLFTNRERMSDNQLYASFCTIAMLCIMIPLTVMSFPKIRKKMDAKLWKKIQRTAYLFYALIYIHVMFLTLPMAQAGREGYTFSVIVYTLVFFGYAFFRVRKAVLKKENATKKIVVNGTLTFTVLMISFVTMLALPKNQKNEQPKNEVPKSFSLSTTSTATSATGSTETTASAAKTTEAVTSAVASTTSVLPAETTTEDAEDETDDEDTIDEAITEEPADEISEMPENDEPENVPEKEQPVNDVTEAPAEPQYIYNNGEFSATAYGYDGDVHITITIENDVITNISGWSDESDTWYFDSASGQVIPAVLASQNPDVDAYSGATYSSKAIMEAVKKALGSAKR